MIVNCKRICLSDDFQKKYDRRVLGNNSFRLGYKRCRTCEISIKYDGYLCPCCNIKLANKPKNNKSKRLLNDILGVIRY